MTEPPELEAVRKAAEAWRAVRLGLIAAMREARKTHGLRPVAEAAGLAPETVRKLTAEEVAAEPQTR